MNDAAMNPAIMLAAHRGDWMRKALGIVRMDGKQMAEYLGVDDATVSRWLNGKRKPGKQTMRLWAMRTGVPLSYLETGVIPDGWTGPDNSGNDNGSRLGESNSRPSHYKWDSWELTHSFPIRELVAA